MANCCFNEVYLTGRKADLLEVMRCYNLIDGRKTLEALHDLLGLTCEGWGRSYDKIELFEFQKLPEDSQKEGIFISVCTAWGPVDDFWSNLCEKYSLNYFSYSEVDGEAWVTNDPKKVYFPDEYIVSFSGDLPGGVEDEVTHCKNWQDLRVVAYKSGVIAGAEKSEEALQGIRDALEEYNGDVLEITRECNEYVPY